MTEGGTGDFFSFIASSDSLFFCFVSLNSSLVVMHLNDNLLKKYLRSSPFLACGNIKETRINSNPELTYYQENLPVA